MTASSQTGGGPQQHISRPRIAVVAGTSIGGTEKQATILAAGLSDRGYTVDYISREGPRSQYLRAHSVRCIEPPGTAEEFCAYLDQARPAVVHQHVAGYRTENFVYPALRRLQTSGRSRPKLIETNIFGRLEDPESERFGDFRLFISAASAAQAFRRAGLEPSPRSLQRQTVLYCPVARPSVSCFTISPAQRTEVRRQLGVGDTDVLAVRVGQPGHKWNSSEAAAFRLARQLRRDLPLRLLLMEPPSPLRDRIAAGEFGDGIIIREATSDFRWLELVYAASDLMIHASDWGESFGYTLAEGMAAGLPIITRSTPWGDNAQVELVENAVSGFVCWSVAEMSRRLAGLAAGASQRQRLGAAAQQRILALADADRELNLLEEVIACVLFATPAGPLLRERRAALLTWTQQFPAIERDTSDKQQRFHLDQLAATAYSAYRRARSAGRALLNRSFVSRRKTE